MITAEQLLAAAEEDGALDRIVLAAGTYDLTRAISIRHGRALTIEAEEVGTVVLDANGLFGPVVNVNGTATLSGLNVTGGAGSKAGGGVYVAGEATLINTNIYSNRAMDVNYGCHSNPQMKRSIAPLVCSLLVVCRGRAM